MKLKMLRKVLGSIILLVLLYAVNVVMAQNIAKDSVNVMNEEYVLEYKFKKGMEIEYEVNSNMQMKIELSGIVEQKPMQTKMKIKQKVLDQEGQYYIVKSTLLEAQIIKDGETASLEEENKEILVKFTNKGKAILVKGDPSWSGSEFSQMELPDHPIKIGYSWEQKTTKANSNVDISANYKLVDVIKSEKGRLAKIETEIKIYSTEKANQVTNKGYILFDLDLGLIKYTEYDMDSSFPTKMPDGEVVTYSSTGKVTIKLLNIVQNK